MIRTTVLVLVLASSGCATVTRGSSEAFVIETDPTGASATLSTGQQCKTPCSLELKRKKEFVVKIEKDGYELVEANISSQVAGAGAAGMAGNVLLGGLIGAAVDVGTGATKELKPNPLVVKLVPLDAADDVKVVHAAATTTKIAFAELPEPEHFYQPDPAAPNGTILMAQPPPSVENKGIEMVSITAVDGKVMPPGTDRMFRISPGTYNITFAQPKNLDANKTVEFEVTEGAVYSVGWRQLGDDWEPVVYDVGSN